MGRDGERMGSRYMLLKILKKIHCINNDDAMFRRDYFFYIFLKYKTITSMNNQDKFMRSNDI